MVIIFFKINRGISSKVKKVLDSLTDASKTENENSNSLEYQQEANIFSACDKLSVFVEITSSLLPLNTQPILSEVEEPIETEDDDQMVNLIFKLLMYLI